MKGAPSANIAIIGGGPTGYALASLLALRGIRAVVFDDGRKPKLIVGESLLPPVVTLFRKLGIEDRLAAISTHKPGASFFHTNGDRIDFSFANAENPLPGYAYNAPRPALDDLLRERALELGVRVVRERAKFSFDQANRRVRLRTDSLAAMGLTEEEHPTLLVDATGRTRTFARGLDLPNRRGGRDDLSHFAHFEGFRHDEVCEGQIIISALTHGWSWRIPLPGRLSVGVVIDRKTALRLGNSAEERLEAIIAREPLLKDHAKRAKRVTPVVTYANYQWIAEIIHGDGWILAGDALGFVDPMLSPGVFMALESARLLDEVVFSNGVPTADLDRFAKRYQTEMNRWHTGWDELIQYFYGGEIFQFYWAGQEARRKHGDRAITRRIDAHFNRTIAKMASGGATRSAYGRHLLRFFAKYLVKGAPPASQFAVH